MKTLKYCTWLVLLIGLLHANRSEAFVDLVRHGYTNCTTCHVSPSGGGILTDYGKKLSLDVLSTWGHEKEVGNLHGLIPQHEELEGEQPEKWLGVGGDIRAAQFLKETEYARSERFIWMQGLVEVAARIKSLTADIAVGRFDHHNVWTSDATRFYLLYQVNDEHSLRVGRFLPSFGLNIPEHISPTRGSLGLGFNNERDGAEWTYLGESWHVALGASKNPQNLSSGTILNEKSVNAQVQRVFGESTKVGASAWYGQGDNLKRQMLGLHGAVGLTKDTVLLAELDMQAQQPTGADSTIGYYGHYRLGHELFKGFQAFAWFDHSQSNAKESLTFTRHWGPGFAFYPRPHFEVSGAWLRELSRQTSSQEGDYAWLLLHYYL